MGYPAPQNRNHCQVDTTRPLVEHLRQVSRKSDQWSRRRCDNEIVTVVNKGQIAIQRWPLFSHVDRPWYSFSHLDIERNSYARFRQNSSSGFGGDAITVKIKDGCRWPYLSTDWNHFRACTTKPLGEHLGQVLKNLTSGLWGDAIMRLLQCWVMGN